jgi:peptidoglycan/LPS O-acetylase OafA/YrhL
MRERRKPPWSGAVTSDNTSQRISSPLSPRTSNQRGAPLPHLAALDGVRGFAVLGVLLFHGGFTWAKGGFLGVSTFFTLSGFLITNLLVRERERTESLDLLRFWGRRLRRLMPAALATIGLIGIVWWRIGTPEQLATLRGDMLASLGYVANWRLWSSGVSYGSLFSEPTPFQHFWSLAIEEQFYVIFPIVVLVLMKAGGRRLLTTFCALAAAASIGLMWWQRTDFDRVYYGTDTRVAELLFGVLLALWWSKQPRNTSTATKTEPLFDVVGVLATLVIVVAWVTVHESAIGLAQGGLPVYAAASTVLIYCATRAGFLARAFSLSSLRWAGLLSYGLYLYHWPIFLLLSEERTGLPLGPLFLLRMAVTIAAALLSYFLLEMPIRRKTLLSSSKSASCAALASIGIVALCAFAVSTDPPQSAIPYANMKVGSLGTTTVSLSPPTSATSQTAKTVWIIGDSAAVDEAPALASAFESAGASTFLFGAGPGFGLTNPEIDWRRDWSTVIAENKPELVVLMFGSWDLSYIRANGEEAYTRTVEEAIALLTSNGIRVMLLPVMPGGSLDVSAVDRVFAKVAERNPLLVANPSIRNAFQAPDGTTPRYWVDDAGVVHLLRKTDNWHLCQEGAANLAALIVAEAVQRGWSSPVTSDWTNGAWRAAWQYDDPPNACDAPS